MEGNLVIVESPAKAKTIQKFLGEGYTVKPSFGHIRDLQEKQLSIDVEHGFKPEYVVPDDKKKVVSDLKKLADKAALVWLASDEDREGEAISWHLQDTLGLDKAKTRRIVFHEITKDAILGAVKNPREVDMDLVNAQQARRVLDRLVGFELSPILWKKINRGLSAGRVQSVALRLVVDREREIMAFKPESFYRVEAVFTCPDGTKVKGVLGKRFKGEEEARTFLEDSAGAVYTIEDTQKKEAERWPAPPFTTSTLQQEASRKLHFPVSVTMRVAQGLYERGLITYMRTDSTNLSSLALGTSKKFIIEQFGEEYSHPRQYRTHSKGAQEAHEAIRPTYVENTSIEGTAQEQKLYSLIWKRTVASQMAEARVENTEITVGIDKRPEKYLIQGSRILFDGFLKLYSESLDDEQADDDSVAIIPDLHNGDRLGCGTISANCKFTKPPFRYSEATLVKKLEELGIGRPSTYAPTISTLTTGRGYIVKGDKEGQKFKVHNLSSTGGKISSSVKTETVGDERGKLLPQEVGIIVTDYLVANFPDILDYDFTANVEKDFDSIAEGKLAWNEEIAKFYAPFHAMVEANLHDGVYSHVERALGNAPDGEPLVARYGQYGAYVQKGEGDERKYASLAKGQLIENITLEEALKLFELPRTVGEYQGIPVVALKGRFGPYLKWGDRNFSLPRGKDPLKVSLEECSQIIGTETSKPAPGTPIAEFGDIQVLRGLYGPYIKFNGSNYKLPKGTDPTSLTEEECRRVIADGKPTEHKGRFRRYSKKK
ncbi:MAG: type I DNA topoisomerase [Bacteroidales bacterium]|nr:type I DNA topoisomerase [Bacteroidales bacterium]